MTPKCPDCKRDQDDCVCVDPQGRIEELEREVARLKTVPMKYRRMAFNAQLQDECNALLADNARLRGYLTRILEYWTQDGNNQELFDMLCHIEETVKAELAATPAQSLARLRNQVRDECVGVCDRFAEREMHPAECAAAIRAMKEPE